MVEYNTINAKLSDSQLSKLTSAVKNKQGTTLRMNFKISIWRIFRIFIK